MTFSTYSFLSRSAKKFSYGAVEWNMKIASLYRSGAYFNGVCENEILLSITGKPVTGGSSLPYPWVNICIFRNHSKKNWLKSRNTLNWNSLAQVLAPAERHRMAYFYWVNCWLSPSRATKWVLLWNANSCSYFLPYFFPLQNSCSHFRVDELRHHLWVSREIRVLLNTRQRVGS